jgi:hypothetical protein
MTSSTTIAVSIVRAWTRAYTCGAPAEWAMQRLADIESDLWEFEHDPHGAREVAPAIQVLWRLAAGIADDLRWRLERTTLQDNVMIRRAVTLAAATIVLSMLWGSQDAGPRLAGCPGAPRKPRVEQVVKCVGAFFDATRSAAP